MRCPRTLAWMAVLFGALGEARADDAIDPIARVRAGVALFEQGELSAAADAFSEAAVARPEDPLIAFDRGTTALALADWDRALELLRDASLARDTGLAARALYNLATASLEQAKQVFGERPEEADDEAMAEGVELLERAMARYRDCLALDPDHADARYNLELIRTWLKHMRALWEERARQKKREEMSALAFLEWLREQQVSLRHGTRALRGSDDSARRRQSIRDLVTAQERLREELPFLEGKLEALVAEAMNQQQEMSPEQMSQVEQAVDALAELVEQAGSSMEDAAHALESSDLEAADPPQYQALQRFQELLVAIAPFARVLELAIEDQEALLSEARAAGAGLGSDPGSSSGPAPTADPGRHGTDPPYLAQRQREMGYVLDGVLHKATTEIPKLEEMLEQMPAEETTPEETPEESEEETPEGPPDPREQLEAVLEACRLAEELIPQARDLSDDASGKLEGAAFAEAIPLQEEILALLKKIQDELPRSEESQDRQQQSEDQEPSEESEQPKEPEEPSESEQEESGEDEAQDPKAGEAAARELSPSQIEAMLRKAQQREDEYLELKKQRQQMLGRRQPQKDW